MEKDKDSGAKGRSEAVSDARDWESLGVVLEWVSGAVRRKKGVRPQKNPVGQCRGQKSGPPLVRVKQ